MKIDNAYRYFSFKESPFNKHHFFKDREMFLEHYPNGVFDSDYQSIREATEDAIRKEFIKKGGKPKIDRPHYMVLGNCDEWFKGIKGYGVSLSIPLQNFDEETLSFTYGDSIPVMNGQIKGPYAEQVYTLSEIKEIIEKYGMPQKWNTFEEYGPENYIEIQVWSDDVIDYYSKSDVDMIEHVDRVSDAVILATPNIMNELQTEQMTFKTVVGMMDGWEHLDLFSYMLRMMNSRLYERDRIHGVRHAIHTAIYCAVLCNMRGYSRYETALALNAAIHHDIGRTIDKKEHGKKGADLFRETYPLIESESKSIIMAAIHAHSCHDDESDDIISGYGIPENKKEVAKEVSDIIKDCDSLDYIRLGIDAYHPKYIRRNDACSLVKFAMCLNYLDEFRPDYLMKLAKRMITWK